MTLEQIEQMLAEAIARVKTLRKIRRIKIKEAELSKQISLTN